MFWKVALLIFAISSGIEGLGEKMMPGGAKVLTEKEIKADERLQGMESILMQIADIYNKRSNSLYAYRVAETVQIKRRVVAGLEYEFTLKFVPTECKKNQDKFLKDDLKNCEISDGRPQICMFTAWYRPWLILGAPLPLKIDMKGCK